MDNKKTELFCNHRIRDDFVIMLIFAAEETRRFFVFLLIFIAFLVFFPSLSLFLVSILY